LTDAIDPVELFVYGTLVPGERAWDVVAQFVTHHRPATVVGCLYDTGRGDPAATFGDTDGVVQGFVLTLAGGDQALAALDEFEGPEYDRVDVRTTDGAVVVAYEWNGHTGPLTAIRGGTWASAPGAPKFFA
jgi:gamma-glutamylcyclotransferase (GGCT)/AIG2-like uncharacterized protein YtfP